MANCCTVVTQSEMSTLKDTLCAQQKLLQQLYNELEAEREASATAASEALSVILRLQGEKAAVKMEAEQYKRLAEEKIGYAEESFAMIEDMITEKEMEVAELDYQVQTYRYQLMSMGFDVPAGDDSAFPEETSLQQHFKGKKAMFEQGSTINEDSELIAKAKPLEEVHVGEIGLDLEKKADASSHHEGISCLAGQIKELQLRVQEIAGANANIPGFMSECQTPAISRRPSAVNLCSLANSDNTQAVTRLPSQLSIVVEDLSSCHHHPTVHDVFEVPQIDRESTSHESPNKDKQKGVCESQDQDKANKEAVKMIPKDEPDWLKKLLHSSHDEMHLCKPSDIAAIDRGIVQPTTSVAVSFVQPPSVDVSDMDKLNKSPEMSEVERPNREEELRLLKEIKEKLSALQDEISFQKVQKPFMRDEPSLQPLAEVMVSFWL